MPRGKLKEVVGAAFLVKEILVPSGAANAQRHPDQAFQNALVPDRQQQQLLSPQSFGAYENIEMREQLQQQENKPAVVPEFPLTQNDLVAIEAYFQQQYGVSIEQAIGDQGYVIFNLKLQPDRSLPLAFDANGPLNQQLTVVLTAVQQAHPEHPTFGLQMNLSVEEGMGSLGFSLVYQQASGFSHPGAQEYLDPDNQFKYLTRVRPDTEVVLFRVDESTSGQIGNLELVENGVSYSVSAPDVGTLMLVERYPDDYADESKRGVVVSFELGDRAFVVGSELPIPVDGAPVNGDPQVNGPLVVTPDVNTLSLASFPSGEGDGELEVSVSDTGESWESYGVSEQEFNTYLAFIPPRIRDLMLLPETDPNHAFYSESQHTVARYIRDESGSVVNDENGEAKVEYYRSGMVPDGRPENESWLQVVAEYYDPVNDVTFAVEMNPGRMGSREKYRQFTDLEFSQMFKDRIGQIDLSSWAGHTVRLQLLADWNTSMDSTSHMYGFEGEGEFAYGASVLGDEIHFRAAWLINATSEEFHDNLVSRSLSDCIFLMQTHTPDNGFPDPRRTLMTSQGITSDARPTLNFLSNYDQSAKTYTNIIEVD